MTIKHIVESVSENQTGLNLFFFWCVHKTEVQVFLKRSRSIFGTHASRQKQAKMNPQ